VVSHPRVEIKETRNRAAPQRPTPKRRDSQVVRQRSAKPLFVGSIPTPGSKIMLTEFSIVSVLYFGALIALWYATEGQYIEKPQYIITLKLR
jgi:hypothetical protein